VEGRGISSPPESVGGCWGVGKAVVGITKSGGRSSISGSSSPVPKRRGSPTGSELNGGVLLDLLCPRFRFAISARRRITPLCFSPNEYINYPDRLCRTHFEGGRFGHLWQFGCRRGGRRPYWTFVGNGLRPPNLGVNRTVTH
jgi:hypothetical protein